MNNDESEFFDNETVYRFVFDVDFRFPLYRVLNIGENDNAVKVAEKSLNRLSLQDVNKKFLAKFWKGMNILSSTLSHFPLL